MVSVVNQLVLTEGWGFFLSKQQNSLCLISVPDESVSNTHEGSRKQPKETPTTFLSQLSLPPMEWRGRIFSIAPVWIRRLVSPEGVWTEALLYPPLAAPRAVSIIVEGSDRSLFSEVSLFRRYKSP